jgi:hypothetical protein
MAHQPLIFVSIASYRDPQLIPTIEDALAKASRPENLRFGICWQHGDDEGPLPFASDERFRILDVDWRESRGICWARAEIMKLHAGEEWFLQLDAHHRFVPDWDRKLLDAAARSGSDKPIITVYAPPFRSDRPGETLLHEAWQMNFYDFLHGCIPVFRGAVIPEWQQRTAPIRGRFVSGHLLFAPGRFVHDVPYDPELFYCGEEITVAVRAFTHGYDIFHPNEPILWHEYADQAIDPQYNRFNDRAVAHRPSRGYVWSDHRQPNGVAVNWYDRETASIAKIAQFLREPFVGLFGCGTVRTVEDYERYAGLSFRYACTTDYTRQFLEPPNRPEPDDWAARIPHYEITIHVDKALLPGLDADCKCWVLRFEDERGSVLYAPSFDRDQIGLCLSVPGEMAIVRSSFASQGTPVSWKLWPYSKRDGFLPMLEGVGPRAYAHVRRIAPWDLMNGRQQQPAAR